MELNKEPDWQSFHGGIAIIDINDGFHQGETRWGTVQHIRCSGYYNGVLHIIFNRLAVRDRQDSPWKLTTEPDKLHYVLSRNGTWISSETEWQISLDATHNFGHHVLLLMAEYTYMAWEKLDWSQVEGTEEWQAVQDCQRDAELDAHANDHRS